MPTSNHPENIPTHRTTEDSVALSVLKLAESLADWHLLRFPTPYEPKKDCADPVAFLQQIKEDTLKLQERVAHDPSYQVLRTCLGLSPHQLPDERHLQIVALAANADFVHIHTEETPDSLANRIAAMLSDDFLTGKLAGRRVIAELLEKGVLTLSGPHIHTNEKILLWLSGNHPLCVPSLNETALDIHLAKIGMAKAAKAARNKSASPPPSPTWMDSPEGLYRKLREAVIGQDEACRVLATRGWLHLKRAELLAKATGGPPGETGQQPGSNECLFFISRQSGVGKTWLAENYGKLCGLPFVSFSATDATSVGFVGLDLVEDALKLLLKASGAPDDRRTLPRARRGIIFYDEFTKKRAQPLPDGRDISGTAVQQEILRVMEGCKVQLGNRKANRENGFEFDTTGLMFIFGGYVEGFDKVIESLNRKGHGMGFREEAQRPRMRDAYLYDALVDYGFIPEFVNRLSRIVMFRKLDVDDLVKIASSPTGVIASYNQVLEPSGLSFQFNGQGLRLMAELCLETGQLARGFRLIVSSLVEDAVFNGAKGTVVFGVQEVMSAISRATSLASTDLAAAG
jgi:ATP-dependent protease Clp ATPase subunit